MACSLQYFVQNETIMFNNYIIGPKSYLVRIIIHVDTN